MVYLGTTRIAYVFTVYWSKMSSQSCSSSTSNSGQSCPTFHVEWLTKEKCISEKCAIHPHPPFCMQFFWGKVLSHKIHGNRREYYLVQSYCIRYLAVCLTPVLSIKIAASKFFSYAERNRMTLSAEKMMTIKWL